MQFDALVKLIFDSVENLGNKIGGLVADVADGAKTLVTNVIYELRSGNEQTSYAAASPDATPQPSSVHGSTAASNDPERQNLVSELSTDTLHQATDHMRSLVGMQPEEKGVIQLAKSPNVHADYTPTAEQTPSRAARMT